MEGSVREGHAKDVFDELEEIHYSYDYLLTLTISKILTEMSEDQVERGHEESQGSEVGYEGERVTYERENLSSIVKREPENIPGPDSFVSIYDILPDSYRAVFLPSRGDLLEKLKRVSSRKSGINKKTHKDEGYSWRSPGSFLTYEEGGRLSEQICNRTGKLINWYLPFYGYCDNIMNDLGDGEDPPQELRKESKRVCCLLCRKLETLQSVKNTLIRHLKTHHNEYYTIYCNELLLESSQSHDEASHLELVMKQASFIFNDFMSIRTVCEGSLSSFAQLLNPKFHLFDERRLIDCLLFSLYAPSFQFLKDSLKNQLAALPNSIVLKLDLCAASHATYPAISCNLSWINAEWVHTNYFLGLIWSASHWTQLTTSLMTILTSIGIQIPDCFTLTAPRSPLVTHLSSSLHIYSVEDFFGDLMTTLAKALLNEEFSSLIGTNSQQFHSQHHHHHQHRHENEKVSEISFSLIQSLRRANNLIDYLNKNLKFPLSHDLSILQLDCIDWDNLISLSSSLARLLQLHVLIENYFSSTPSSSSSSSSSSSYLHDMDWKIWSELISILEPIRSIETLLQERNHCHLSLLWYIIDWVVNIYEQSSYWEVYSVSQNKPLLIPSSSLSPFILSFKSTLVSILRNCYLTDTIKITQPRLYETLCLATYLDPRTKNFHFFSAPSLGYSSIYYHDAKYFVLNEVRNEICTLLEIFLSAGIDEFQTSHQQDYYSGVNAILQSILIASGISLDSLNTSASTSASTFPFNPSIGLKRKILESIPNKISQSSTSTNIDDDNYVDNTTATAAPAAAAAAAVNDNDDDDADVDDNNNDNINSGGGGGINEEVPLINHHREKRSSQYSYAGLSLGILRDKLQLSALRESIDEYCRREIMTYEHEPLICPPHQIHFHNPLDYWSRNHLKYPILSRIARRFLSIQMDLPSPKLKDLTSRIYSKNRQPMCPILFEAIVFLHLNGILTHQFSDFL